MPKSRGKKARYTRMGLGDDWAQLIPDDWVSMDGTLWKNMRRTAQHREAWNNRFVRKLLPLWWRDAHAQRLRAMRATGEEAYIERHFIRPRNPDEIVRNRLRRLPPDATTEYKALKFTLSFFRNQPVFQTQQGRQEAQRVQDTLIDFWSNWDKKIDIEKQKVLERYERWKPYEDLIKSKEKARMDAKIARREPEKPRVSIMQMWDYLIPEDWVAQDGRLWRDMNLLAQRKEEWNNPNFRRILPRWWRDEHAKERWYKRRTGGWPIVRTTYYEGYSEEGVHKPSLWRLPPEAGLEYLTLNERLLALRMQTDPLSEDQTQEVIQIEQKMEEFLGVWEKKMEIEKQKILDRYEELMTYLEKKNSEAKLQKNL